MDRSSVRVFAVWARAHLREQVAAKAARFGITAKGLVEPQYVSGGMSVAGFTHDGHETELYKELRADLHAKVRAGATQKRAVESLIDEAAFTWFNRLTALRFMEVNGYTTRALSSTTPGMVDPELLQHATSLVSSDELPGVSLSDLDRWRKQGDGVAYRNLLVAQCTKLAEPLPFLFGEGKRYAALLLPDNLLNQGSIIRRLVNDIPEEDWREIEIIGWLYQFYISERKDEVIGAKGAVAAQDIPAATQLFTPHWIVRYMVENSLGRLWLEAHPESNLRQHMPYYLEGKSEKPTGGNPDLKPQDLTVMDPACGSGHILTYAFDLLYNIYLEQGFPERDIATLILRHNLYGLDIDERAAQLASFALMMKAREKDRRVMRDPPPLNLAWTAHTRGWAIPNAPELNKNDWQPLIDAFKDADNLGSLTTPPPFNPETLGRQLAAFEASGRLGASQEAPKLRQLLHQAALLAKQYDAVIANPPYMGSESFNKILKDYVNAKYSRSKRNLFAVFMERCLELTQPHGIMSMINQHSWMFVSSYEQLREHLLDNYTLQTMLHLGPRAFPEIGGEVVQSTTFTIANEPPTNQTATYVRLVEFGTSSEKEEAYLRGEQQFAPANQHAFETIPGRPIAYWASNSLLNTFLAAAPLGSIATLRKGIFTGANNRFLRFWQEVEFPEIEQTARSMPEAKRSNRKWYLYTKGGEFRRFYGNLDHVVNFKHGGEELSMFGGSGISAANEIFFKEALVWSGLTTGSISFRVKHASVQNDDAAPALIPHNRSHLMALLSLLNSQVADLALRALNPTLNYQVGDLRRFPALPPELGQRSREEFGEQAFAACRWDWDNFELSWDFQSHPLVRGSHVRVSEAFAAWEREANHAFYDLKRLEEDNNRYWINAYGLQDELNPEVPEDQITIRKADQERDIKSLISYAIGCMMGRYSLTTPGLQFAGGNFNPIAFTGEFQPDDDGILPITDEAYFEEDVITRFTAFLRAAFGPDHIQENVTFIADTLTRRAGETALERIRRYFVNEFITDHNRTYSKRPIYWLFTSGKERAFGALVYLHRYQSDTLAKLRNDYVLPLQGKLENEIRQTQRAIEAATSTAAARREERKLKKLKDQVAELLGYQDKLLHKADQRIDIDLDDGVAYNYTLFDGLVYEGPDLKMQDLHKHSQWKRDLLDAAKRPEAR